MCRVVTGSGPSSNVSATRMLPDGPEEMMGPYISSWGKRTPVVASAHQLTDSAAILATLSSPRAAAYPANAQSPMLHPMKIRRAGLNMRPLRFGIAGTIAFRPVPGETLAVPSVRPALRPGVPDETGLTGPGTRGAKDTHSHARDGDSMRIGLILVALMGVGIVG